MIIETKRTTFDPIVYPLAAVEGGSTKAGVVIDFDAKNQMVETNQVLEVYMAKAAVADETVTPGEGEEPDVVTAHEPTLQIKILTGDDEETLAVVQSSEVFAVADLVEGFVLYKAALPDRCGQLVRVDLVNAVDDNDFKDGLIVGTVRPL
jgi:hypothetical protein